ncbi:MAG: molybdate ABC transporter substrate-binding protein, partial [Peptococcaceae bacterium]|nr:molybdate ABC transporter substrate-binding protein [Peptococcaceae bacterium]
MILLGILSLALFLTGCSNSTSIKETTITVAAAASLKNCLDEKLIPVFQQRYPNIKIQTTYDGSGKLQTQIQQGAPIDIFISAAMTQMIGLEGQGLILEDSVVQLLENKIVLIVPENSTKGISTFGDIIKAEKIAIGD